MQLRMKARDAKVAVFEEETPEDLEDALNEWLGSRAEEELLGVEFDADADQSYRAFVIYTE